MGGLEIALLIFIGVMNLAALVLAITAVVIMLRP